MVTAPPVRPVSTPVPAPSVATEVSLMAQVPPDVPSAKREVRPAQPLAAPEIAAGVGFMVIARLTEQPPSV